MLRAMLVDDEPLALEGLKLMINWQAEGFEICCECANADEALLQLPLVKPDLIVTDIRMPGMSGLELLKASRQAGFDGQFIIVSGYSDFNYARTALQIGVAGYLLKPIEPADAASVLAYVRRKLIGQAVMSDECSKALHHTITALLTEYEAPESDIPPTTFWHLATWGAPLPYHVVHALLALFIKNNVTAHIVEDKEYLVIRMQTGERAPDFSEATALLARHHRHLTFCEPTDDPSSLAALRKQLSSRMDKACHSAITQRVNDLIRIVALRQADECKTHCTELETFCAAHGANAITRARRQLISACAGLFAGRAEALTIFLHSQDANIQTLCLHAIKLLVPQQERVSDRMERYARELNGDRLTVKSVAVALGYNATYLGRIYREERGSGFREWLANQRIQQGAALLRSTDHSVCSIAKAVGYEHYKSFLRHFKQCYGITPEQYRRQNT